jgi:hypothetical protein
MVINLPIHQHCNGTIRPHDPCGHFFCKLPWALHDIDRGGVIFFGISLLDITLHVYYDGLESGRRVSRHRYAARRERIYN